MTGRTEKIAITAHMRPDGDAVGSCIALYHCLKDIGRDAFIVLPDASPDYLGFITSTVEAGHFLDWEGNEDEARRALSGCGLLFSLDYNAFHRTGKMEEFLSGMKVPKVLIDHHLNPERDQFSLVFSETGVSSTAEYLYHILMAASRYRGNAKMLPPASATALMTGMTTDTNNFANSVFPTTLDMASALLDAGVDRDLIIDKVFNSYKETRIRLMGYLLDRCLTITGDGVAYMILGRKTIMKFGIQDGDTEGFVNIPLAISNVRMSIFLKQDKDRFRVSIRSKKGTSANRCAREYFNGGGHELASGGKLMIPDDVKGIKDAAAYIEKVTHIFFSR